MNRRHFLAASGASAAALTTTQADHHEKKEKKEEKDSAKPPHTGPNRIGVSSYSFWGFRRPKNGKVDPLQPISTNLEHAARMGWLASRQRIFFSALDWHHKWRLCGAH